MNDVAKWAARHGVNQLAIAELLTILAMPPAPVGDASHSEKATQSNIRLRAPQWFSILWRNNVGVLRDETGVPVRYGLANDSVKLNKHVKSSDLIGFTRRVICAADVGFSLPIFTAIECKRGRWVWTGTDREVAQQRFMNIVKTAGGLAGFAQSVEDFDSIMKEER